MAHKINPEKKLKRKNQEDNINYFTGVLGGVAPTYGGQSVHGYFVKHERRKIVRSPVLQLVRAYLPTLAAADNFVRSNSYLLTYEYFTSILFIIFVPSVSLPDVQAYFSLPQRLVKIYRCCYCPNRIFLYC